MNIEYICHACLVIETEDLRIATDPWISGAANCGQWHIFPKPVNAEKLLDVNAILISHGHEDHLHEESLRMLPKAAQVFYPYTFFGGAKEYIESIGYRNVIEAVTLRKYQISEKTAVTFVINSHDSLMVIESGGKVLVNVNDALHSYPEKVIDFYLGMLKERWPVIDYVFCGFGGSSYFPNTMHLAGKDDVEIGFAREQLFANNFCRIVKGLRPKAAVPFAVDFVLLDEKHDWINKVRFRRSKISEYYDRYFAGSGYRPQILPMYSGDRMEDGEIVKLSPYHEQMIDGELGHLVEKQYSDEIKSRRRKKFITDAEADILISEVKANVERRMTLYKPWEIDGVNFCLQITDLERNNYFHVALNDEKAKVWRADAPATECLLMMSLTSKVLSYSIGSDWGADVISVGYGAEIFISDNKAAEVDMERVCMNLLACYPTVSDLKKSPIRTLQFLLLNPPKFTTSIRKLKKFNLESENYDRKTWLLKNSNEIRQIYDLPELDPQFLPAK